MKSGKKGKRVHGRDARARCVNKGKRGNTVNVLCLGDGENERRRKLGGVKDDRMASESSETIGGRKNASKDRLGFRAHS